MKKDKADMCEHYQKDIKRCIGAYGHEYILGCKGRDKECVMYEDKAAMYRLLAEKSAMGYNGLTGEALKISIRDRRMRNSAIDDSATKLNGLRVSEEEIGDLISKYDTFDYQDCEDAVKAFNKKYFILRRTP